MKLRSSPAGHKSPALNHRLWIPLLVGGLALAGLAFAFFKPDLESNFRAWTISSLILLAVLLELVWFLALSRFHWKLRLGTLGLLLVLVFTLSKTLRVDGTVNGTGLPKLAWRWTVTKATLPETVLTKPSSKMVVQSASDVPQFFGPHRDGVVTNAGLSADWTNTPPKELWRRSIGAGWSAFAVVNGLAYTEEQRGEAECVTCYELSSGQLMWCHSNAVHFMQWQSSDGPHATPSVDDGKVFAMGATGVLNCLDAATGRQLWTRNVLEENKLPNLTWGVSDSPLVFDNTIVVTGGQSNGPTVLAYRKTDGQPLWHAGTDGASYASPILAVLAGHRVVLTCNFSTVTACDPASGELLLDYPWINGHWPKASQPVVIEGDRLFLSAGYGAGCMMLQIKAGADGKLIATQLWKNLHMKTQFNSAALRNGYLYGLDDGLMACVDISNGERKWKDGRFGSGQTLLVDDFVIIQSESGDVVLGEAHPDGFKELGRIAALKDKTWNYPTLAGRYLLVRNNQEAVCYELPLKKG